MLAASCAGPFDRHPDFVALHLRQDIVVLEVKDWRHPADRPKQE